VRVIPSEARARSLQSSPPARVSELADDGALKALAPKGACGFESHPGHQGGCGAEDDAVFRL
jgi:hypothetical protein